MATTAINAGLDVILKSVTALQKIKNVYNQATREIQAFTKEEDRYNEQVCQWKELLRKYPLPADHSVIACVNKAAKDLEKQVQHIQKIEKSNSCYRFWNKTWSSESLIASLTGVDIAFNSISVYLEQRQQAEQVVEQEAHKLRSPFSFAADEKYVPIDKTVKNICRALEDDGSLRKVVLLHGGSGEGKSTMAKYIALHYYHQKTKGGSLSSNSCRFSDGVVFLSCGQNADSLSLMQQLSEDLGYNHDASQVRGRMGGSDRQELEPLKKWLICMLENGKRILIIVDDVWDPLLIADLMMPLKDVTYLITSQLKTIWLDAKRVSIDSPSVEEARQIFANHIVGWNCKPFPPQIQEVVDDLIEKVQRHPLVLANLATLINREQVPQLEKWIQLNKKWKTAIRLADQPNVVCKPTVFDEPYKRNVVTSLTMAINLIGDDAKSLMFALAACTGDGVEENVLRLWFKVLRPDMYAFSFAYSELRERSLISTMERKMPGRARGREKPLTICSIHDLRRELICGVNQREVEDNFEKLISGGTTNEGSEGHISRGESDEDLAAALCFVYGDVKYRQKAHNKIQIHRILQPLSGGSWFRNEIKVFVTPFATLLHPGFEDACNYKKATHELARSVILHSLRFYKVKDEAVSKLLDIPEAFPVTCSALRFRPLNVGPTSIPMTIRILMKAVKDMVDTLPESTDDIAVSLEALYHLQFGKEGIVFTELGFPNVIKKILLYQRMHMQM